MDQTVEQIPTSVLLIEDCPVDGRYLVERLETGHFDVTLDCNIPSAIHQIKTAFSDGHVQFEVVMLKMRQRSRENDEFIRDVRSAGFEGAIVFLCDNFAHDAESPQTVAEFARTVEQSETLARLMEIVAPRFGGQIVSQ